MLVSYKINMKCIQHISSYLFFLQLPNVCLNMLYYIKSRPFLIRFLIFILFVCILVSLKMRVATILVLQMYCGGLSGSRDIVKTFEDLQCIYDDIAQLFVEKTNGNALQGYILICLRKIRSLIGEVSGLFKDQRSRLNTSRKPKFPFRNLGYSSFASHVNGDK